MPIAANVFEFVSPLLRQHPVENNSYMALHRRLITIKSLFHSPSRTESNRESSMQFDSWILNLTFDNFAYTQNNQKIAYTDVGLKEKRIVSVFRHFSQLTLCYCWSTWQCAVEHKYTAAHIGHSL